MSYEPSGNPRYRGGDSSAEIRAEFGLISQAFKLLPTPIGAGSVGFQGGTFNAPSIFGGTISGAQLIANTRITGTFMSLGTTSVANPLGSQSPGFWLDGTRRLMLSPGQGIATALIVDQNRNVAVGDGAAQLATTATNGFLYLPSCVGTPTGTPTTITGTTPIVIDSSANRLWVRVSGSWRYATLT